MVINRPIWIFHIYNKSLLFNMSKSYELLVCLHFLLGIYAFSQIIDKKGILNYFRILIIVYSFFSIEHNRIYTTEITICAVISFVLAPISKFDNEKITLDVLWQIISSSILSGFCFAWYFVYDGYNEINAFILGHYIAIASFYLFIILLSQKNLSLSIWDRFKEVWILSIFIIGSIIFYYNPEYNSVQNNSDTSKSQNYKSTFWNIGKFNGKYGEFQVFINKDEFEFKPEGVFVKVINFYDDCKSSIPYCVKNEGVVLSCSKEEFLYLGYSTYRDDQLIHRFREKEDDLKWKSIKSKKIISSVFEFVCNLPQVKSKYLYTSVQDNTEPIYHTPKYKPSYFRTRCRDGTYSDSTGRGTCSHHGGIAR